MATIDMHVHAFPDKLAPRAIATLEAECPWKATSGGTVDELVDSMDAADIDVSVVCTIATKPGQAKGILKWCRQIRSERLELLPSVHPQDRGKTKWVERIAKAGFPGIKLHPMYQDFAADAREAEPIYAAAADNDLLVAVHCGRDIAYPPDDDRAAPWRFARLLEKFEHLKLICTHMGGWRMWAEAWRWLLGGPCYLETSFSLEALGADRAVEMIRAHGPERVLFGTDWPWTEQAPDLHRLRNLPLTPSETNAVLFANAAKLLGL